jgi:RNA-directed DNA polymerase
MPWCNGQGRSGKAINCNADMHVLEKSDCAVVPVTQPNKEARASAEVGEGRAQMKENIAQSHMLPTQIGKRRSQGLDGVRKAARERKQERFTSSLHHLNVNLLRDSFYALQRKASPGVGGVTWQEHETGLEGRLIDPHSRAHRGAHRAQPSRRVYIPKADGRQRPLGIAAVEDKIVQQAVVTILNQIYEVDFKGFSYGFRPGRSPHQALDALTVGIQRKKVNWILDADVLGFFDNLSHEWALKFIELQVADRRILRLIRKWLEAKGSRHLKPASDLRELREEAVERIPIKKPFSVKSFRMTNPLWTVISVPSQVPFMPASYFSTFTKRPSIASPIFIETKFAIYPSNVYPP